MRISLIHGENLSLAYGKYRELVEGSRKKGFEIISIKDVKNITSQSLFEDKIVFILEKPNKVKPDSWKWLAKNASKYNSNLIIYYDGNAPAVIVRSLPKDFRQERFDYPKTLFAFLDNFWPGNSQKVLRLLNDLVKTQPTELVFHMLSRQLRDLYWSMESEETMEIPDWKVLKLTSQAKKFTKESLTKCMVDLAEIDILSKTTDSNLKSMLDIWIVKNLK
jgi:hypothetical protein